MSMSPGTSLYLNRRVENFKSKIRLVKDSDLTMEGVNEYHLLVTHNGSQWTSMNLTLDEMADIYMLLGAKLTEEGKI